LKRVLIFRHIASSKHQLTVPAFHSSGLTEASSETNSTLFPSGSRAKTPLQPIHGNRSASDPILLIPGWLAKESSGSIWASFATDQLTQWLSLRIIRAERPRSILPRLLAPGLDRLDLSEERCCRDRLSRFASRSFNVPGRLSRRGGIRDRREEEVEFRVPEHRCR